jgi:hypothetical protein
LALNEKLQGNFDYLFSWVLASASLLVLEFSDRIFIDLFDDSSLIILACRRGNNFEWSFGKDAEGVV